jgi:putative tryptophan/tyrosine transport system substrate-binding protein
MRRREFVVRLGGALISYASWLRPTRAQQSVIPVIGYLASGAPSPASLLAFRQGLGESAYFEGRNVAIEFRWPNERNNRMPALAADLVSRRVNVIYASGINAAMAAKAATTSLPVIFSVGSDPIELGLVANLNRPGGNLSGTTTLNVQTGPKRLELLHELMPKATIIAFLINPTRAGIVGETKELQAAAATLGLKLPILHASTDEAFDAAFAAMVQLRVEALVIGSDNFFISRSEQLAALSLRHAIPTIFQYRDFAEAGGLMSYGGGLHDTSRQAAAYVGRVLKGEKPADLPVQQATKVELFINLKTARALGLNFPLALLGRADEVFE